MDNYQEEFKQENLYLNKIMDIIHKQLQKEEEKLKSKKSRLAADQRDMYENTTHYSHDFEKLSDAVQYLNPIEIQSYSLEATRDRIKKYLTMQQSPYFARIDFTEEGFDTEQIYIGLGNLSDEKSHQTYICDWRAPISSMFYRYSPGKASYKAPYGTIHGDISLKRQFEIKKGGLKYFFDSDLTIIDDILKQALSQNTDPKMRSIVETIQKEQDVIIRDNENDLLIVQGVAGSGKTSVALHRVAYLMYYGLSSKLNTNNIILITPNNLFEKYIENVLPELGENNIQSLTMEELFDNIFEGVVKAGSRNNLLENIITCTDCNKKKLMKDRLQFVLSKEFIIITDRFLKHFEKRMIDFRDIFYNGECIASRHLLKEELIRQKDLAIPLEKRLETIENRVLKKIHELRKIRLVKLKNFVDRYPQHVFEAKSVARLLSLKENHALKLELMHFTRIDPVELFKKLTGDKELFSRMASGLRLPDNIEELLTYIEEDLKNPVISYDNAMAILAIKLKVSGCNYYSDIKQVVVDEAQDYYPGNYEILRLCFSNSKYTVMGDINQTIEKSADISLYSDIKQIINKKSMTFELRKSFRCSYEINKFSSYLSNPDIDIESYERHEKQPQLIEYKDITTMDESIADIVTHYRGEGYQSIAVICKSMSVSEALYSKIGKRLGASLISSNSFESVDRVTILPVYLAKGLEFDAVIIYDSSDRTYNDPEDRQLLYICCTRALHRLTLIYSEEKSRLLPNKIEY